MNGEPYTPTPIGIKLDEHADRIREHREDIRRHDSELHRLASEVAVLSDRMKGASRLLWLVAAAVVGELVAHLAK